MNAAVVIDSPSNFIFSPVTELAILLDISMVGLPSFLDIFKFTIVRSEPECN